MNFYKTRKWQRMRERILRRDEYLCRECRRYGRTTPAQTAHHIYPAEQYPELALVSANLISLCGPCHDSMHDRTTTKTGERWREKVSPLLRNMGYNV
ncbi:MAG TPA: HNH endonuclease [Peptococcaceae bacterium]|nr:HNH endonuclease [Peptococcaceae bacterium]